jgi:RNA polymerase sigma-70 factor (ECF subfamily)
MEAQPSATLTENPTRDSADDALIARTLSGDERAFEQLARRHAPRVFAIARRFFRSPETAEDIAQETFTRAFFALAGFRQGASFAHWLGKIAINNCYDEMRRRKQRGEWLLTEMAEDEQTWLESKLAAVSLANHIHANERERATEVAKKLLARLPAEDRLVLILLHAEECSMPEIAEIMGWRPTKVKMRAFRARRKMRRALEQMLLIEERQRGLRTVQYSEGSS